VNEFFESRLFLLLVLFIGLITFSASIVFVAIKIPQNERVYLYLVSVASHFSGAFFTLLHVTTKEKP
jgi:hypothetical protein